MCSEINSQPYRAGKRDGWCTIISRYGRKQAANTTPSSSPQTEALWRKDVWLVASRRTTSTPDCSYETSLLCSSRLCRDRREEPTRSHLLQSRVEAGAGCLGLRAESTAAGLGLTGTQGSASCCFGSLGSMVSISSGLFPSIYREEILCKHPVWARVGHVTHQPRLWANECEYSSTVVSTLQIGKGKPEK